MLKNTYSVQNYLSVIKMKSLYILCCVVIFVSGAKSRKNMEGEDFLVGRWKRVHNVEELSTESFGLYSQLSDVEHLRKAIENIALPRVVGTPGHDTVRKYIVDSLSNMGWNVELDSFEAVTPIKGNLLFHNIVAKLNPKADRYLMLACHYDSKYMQNFEFIGATDSAVPCAILLNLATVLKSQLTPFNTANISLMFVFFDGEEAFDQWSATDSIYGARNLAQKWDAEEMIDNIDLLVLLDLIGAPDPTFYSFFQNTQSWYSMLATIEERLSDIGVMKRYTNSGVTKRKHNLYFQESSRIQTTIEDDHLPFQRLGVPILHIIPVPFPSVWHKPEDNLSAIDYDTTENIARILRIFTIQYLLGPDQ